jgi:predicted DCC family thiol-disulfide oxidoreductase YuxK
LNKTKYPPSPKAILVWDGECEFCAYWISYWEERFGVNIEFHSFQTVFEQFPDINKRQFLLASHFIETDGCIYRGARSAYRSLHYAGKLKFLDQWYSNKAWFRKLSDQLYRLVSHNRPTFFKISKYLFGSDPLNLRPFWVVYLFLLLYLISSFI